MEILKGKVQDPGFPDTEVTYLKTDDGKTYFFIENGTLKNGNIISTPILKEGIGHAPYTSLGLIDKDGNVLIPFENKNIKALSDDLLLVEKAKPTTQSVVDAASKQTDPLSAAELIQTSDTIKSQMKSVMGSNSSYVFDNQFSEAALFTASGVNLANNYFSFIGLSNGAYYMSQNVVGSPISKYDPYANAANQAQEETNQVDSQESNNQTAEQTPAEVPTQGETTNTNDPILPNINIGQTQEQQPSNNTEQTENNQAEQTQQIEENTTVPDIEIPAIAGMKVPTANEEANISEENKEETNSNIDINNNDENVSDNNDVTGGILPNIESNSEQASSDADDQQETSNEEPTEEKLKLSISDDTEEETQHEEAENNDSINQEEQDDTPNEEIEENTDSEEDSEEDSTDETETYSDEVEEQSENDVEQETDEASTESDDVEDSKEETSDEYEENNEEEYNNYEEDIEDEISNPVIINATNTIKKLLEENRKQRQIIDRQEGEIETLNSTNEILKEDNSEKTKEIISLRKSMSKYRSDNTDLTRENNHLKSTNSRQEEIIDHLKTQNTTLKEQVAGITALGNAVAEANTLFTPEKENDNDSSNSNIEYSYLGEDDGYQYTKKAA